MQTPEVGGKEEMKGRKKKKKRKKSALGDWGEGWKGHHGSRWFNHLIG